VTNPYAFEPLDVEQAIVDEVVWHHGVAPAGVALHSGELQIEIEALTPLLVGHSQFPAEDVAEQELNDFLTSLDLERDDLLPEGKNKKVLLPLRAGWLTDEPVLLPPDGLKAVVRAGISALCAAPMERVAEQHFSYRPNLARKESGMIKRYVGVIESINFHGSEIHQIRMVLYPMVDCIFVHNPTALGILTNCINQLPCDLDFQGQWWDALRTEFHNGRIMLKVKPIAAPESWLQQQRYSCVRYHHGLDGKADWATRFAEQHDRPRPTLHPAVLVPFAGRQRFNESETCTLTQASSALNQLNATRRLMEDEAIGHLQGRENDVGVPPAHVRLAVPEPNDAMIVEVLNDAGNQSVLTLGHHFNYRVAYADSVRTQLVWSEANGFSSEERPEVRPRPEEGLEDAGGTSSPTGRLSAARGLFGFVNQAHEHHGKLQLGKEAMGRLAGRMAFNHAVEQECNEPLQDRFYGDNTDYWVALPELGSPKASAVEHYLQQAEHETHDPYAAGELWTYGDDYTLRGSDSAKALWVSSRSAGLNGRKGYPHQIEVISSADHFDLTLPFRWGALNIGELANDRAALARWISRPGRRFRCTLTVQDLRDWELGAVVAALEPVRWAAWLHHRLNEQQDAVDIPFTKAHLLSAERELGYGLKLGHARPLGLGSVAFRIKGWNDTSAGPKVVEEQGINALVESAFSALWATLLPAGPLALAAFDKRLAAWLRMRCLFLPLRTYPKPNGGAVFDYHMQHRRAHAEARRGVANPTEPPPNELEEFWKMPEPARP